MSSLVYRARYLPTVKSFIGPCISRAMSFWCAACVVSLYQSGPTHGVGVCSVMHFNCIVALSIQYIVVYITVTGPAIFNCVVFTGRCCSYSLYQHQAYTTFRPIEVIGGEANIGLHTAHRQLFLGGGGGVGQ